MLIPWGSWPSVLLVQVPLVLLATLAGAIGVPGYLISIAVLTPGYQPCQAANHTARRTP